MDDMDDTLQTPSTRSMAGTIDAVIASSKICRPSKETDGRGHLVSIARRVLRKPLASSGWGSMCKCIYQVSTYRRTIYDKFRIEIVKVPSR